MTKHMRTLWFLPALLLVFTACKKEPESEDLIQDFSNGYLILNEGNYGSGNASVSFCDYTTKAVTRDAFKTVNNRPLGDQGQSITIIGDNAYILVQNSGKIEVVNKNTFASVAVIDKRITSPRYMLKIDNNTAYVSDWYIDYVKVVNLNNNKVIDSFQVDNRPEHMVLANGKVYISNLKDYPDDGTLVTVIDPSDNSIITSITTPENPTMMVVDNNDKLWVLCGGNYTGANAKLIKINTSTDVIETTIDLGGTTDYPNYLRQSPDKDVMYYSLGGQLFEISSAATVAPSTPLISRSFYGFSVNPNNGRIHGCVAPNFVSNGKVVIYDEDGERKDSINVGVGPNSCYFR